MLDLEWSDPQTLWLNITNAVLGIVTIVALAAVLGSVAVEVYGRLKKGAVKAADSHTLRVSDLGLTMADGGEEVDESGAPSPKA